jgi:4-hydroxybenzoate polyprenyltransferase
MPARPALPLCVDLDGTLLRSDLLLESLLSMLARRPWLAVLLPVWLLGGKARLKREIALRGPVDAALLPYDERVLGLLRASGSRHRVLCTASDICLAEPIARHLGCFDEVLASDGRTNLAGHNKAAALVERFGERGFEYLGNAPVDLKVWRHAASAYVVNAPASLVQRAGHVCGQVQHMPLEGAGLRVWIKAFRLHQWLKNLLVFVPLLAAHRFTDQDAILLSGLAFLAFGLSASGVYVLNDLLDLEADRAHPRKCLRPFAAGTLSLRSGLLAAPLLTLTGLGLAVLVSPLFAVVLGGYYLLTLCYSLGWKRVPILDVILLAGLYTVRIIGGAAAIGTAPSFWLLAFSMFIFLSLALLKRYIEFVGLAQRGEVQASGRGYRLDDQPLLLSLGGSAGYLSVLVLALYINSPESQALYRHPEFLWLLCPLLLLWISRAWMKAHRGTMHDDPVVFAATDPFSLLVAAIGGLIALAAIYL